MVAKISGSSAQRISTPKDLKEPAKQAPAAQSGAAQKAWQPGAKKPANVGGGLTVSRAELGDGPKTTEKLQLPKGYSQVDGAIKHHEEIKLADGRTAKLDIDWATVGIKGPNGKTAQLNPLQGEPLKEQLEWFRGEFKGAKKEDLEFHTFPEWDASRSFRGAGGAGMLVSVMESGSSYTGGAHPNHGSSVNTYDVRTGKQVKLDQLLSKDQVDKLATNIHARLQTMKAAGEDGIDGSAWSLGGDVKSIRDAINDNFALTQGKNGKVNIELAWESGVHALGGVMAHFTVPAPTDEAFKAKLGME